MRYIDGITIRPLLDSGRQPLAAQADPDRLASPDVRPVVGLGERLLHGPAKLARCGKVLYSRPFEVQRHAPERRDGGRPAGSRASGPFERGEGDTNVPGPNYVRRVLSRAQRSDL